jgi:hypothetical protein
MSIHIVLLISSDSWVRELKKSPSPRTFFGELY